MSMQEGIKGEAVRQYDHHRGFNAALDDAVAKYAEAVGPSDVTELSVTFSVFVSVSNPGRIEKYGCTLGPGS